MAKYYDAYKGMFNEVETLLKEIKGLNVVVGGPWHFGEDMPYAIINPLETTITRDELGPTLHNQIPFEIVLLIREKEPENWFTDIVAVMGSVVDAVLANPTLNDKAWDCIVTSFAPSRITMTKKMYYGGVITFLAQVLFNPKQD